MDLVRKITSAIATPATTDAGFDIHAELGAVLATLGLRPDDGGGEVRFRGADPIVPSTLRLGAAAGIALVAKSIAVAKLWRLRGGAGQDITMDLRTAPHRLCPFYDRKWELLDGAPPGAAADRSQTFGLTFYRTRDDRWVMPMNVYPKIRLGAQTLLGVPDDIEAARTAIAKWNGRDLEEAGARAGIVMPMLRSAAEALEEAHVRDVLARRPLVEIERIGDSAPEPLAPGAQAPLDGVRALGMGHVIAGAGTGRALALHGADVLNLWRPGEFEHDAPYASANVGLRSATLDPRTKEGALRVRELLQHADIFFGNRRPGYLRGLGLTAEEAASIRPGIIHATASLNGETGPWADRIGFDQTAGSLVGMMTLEGDAGTPKLPPILVVNDYIVSWLLAAGIVAALTRRAHNGGSYRVHVSLTRAALWILSLGIFDRAYAHAVAGKGEEHAYLDPEVFSAQTPLGLYQGVTDQVHMSGTPGAYHVVLVPRGSGRAEWR